MRMQNVPLSDIVPNPWRDMRRYPLDTDHIAELKDSIKDHGFFVGVNGRRRNNKIGLGCGHMRIEAAKRTRLETVPIFIDDLDDDQMLRLMTDENALQAGTHPGAVLNEVAAVTRRLIDGLLGNTGTIVPVSVAKAFESRGAAEKAEENAAEVAGFEAVGTPRRQGLHFHAGEGPSLVGTNLCQWHAASRVK